MSRIPGRPELLQIQSPVHPTLLLHLVDNTLEETGALGAVGEMLEGEAQLVENRPENNNNTQFNLSGWRIQMNLIRI